MDNLKRKTQELDSTKIKILICCHKACDLPHDSYFLPIQVGASISDIDLCMQRDDDGDNISTKNRSYCELTAVYWAWKNIEKKFPNIEYIGLNHYRRYFDFCLRPTVYDKIIKSTNTLTSYRIDHSVLSQVLLQNDCILTKPKIYPYSLAVDYCICHYSDDYRVLKTIIKDLYSNYYNTFINLFEFNNKLSHYNMFIMRKKDFYLYCEWLFPILYEAEKLIKIDNYNNIQKRIFGYMAERLMNVYVKQNKITYKYLPIDFYEDHQRQTVKDDFLINCKNILAFNCSNKIFI